MNPETIKSVLAHLPLNRNLIHVAPFETIRSHVKGRAHVLPTDARVGPSRARLVNLGGGSPLAFQAAVGEWARSGYGRRSIRTLNLREILLSGIVPGVKKAFRGDRAICWKGKQIPHGCAVRNDRLFGD